MTRLRRLLIAPFLDVAIVSAIPASHIFRRVDDYCFSKGLDSCPKQLPTSFCCPSDSTCMPLVANFAVLCCPGSSSCKSIQPITCNIREQDAIKKPNAPIKTTVFDVPLESCGENLCCPFGYSCSADAKRCDLDPDQSLSPKARAAAKLGQSKTESAPSATSETTHSTVAATSPATHLTTKLTTSPTDVATPGSSTSPASTSAAATTTPDPAPEQAELPKGAIIGGAVGASVVVALLATICFCIRRRRASGPARSPDGKCGSEAFGQVISAPILQTNSYRSDLLRTAPTPPVPEPRAPQPPSQQLPQQQQLPRVPPPAVRRLSHQQSPALHYSIMSPFHEPISPVSPITPGRSPALSEISLALSEISLGSLADDVVFRTGHVVGGTRLPPIRQMRASQMRRSHYVVPETHVVPETDDGPYHVDKINTFADATSWLPQPSSPSDLPDCDNRMTTISAMMEQAGLGDVNRGAPFVPPMPSKR